MSNFITLDQAIALTKKYRSQKEKMLIPELRDKGILPICETFDSSSFATLVGEPGCVSIRVYLGMSEDLKVRLLAVGVNEKGEDILPAAGAKLADGGGNIVEDGQRCPDICHPSPLSEG
ncbi:MAG TPA: hypothetical protein VK645_14470 [Chitinophagaceae bacterium]|nr:hypothetical protein [Chitinophagaceae bacterium]